MNTNISIFLYENLNSVAQENAIFVSKYTTPSGSY
jgi:hypothetical protein